MLLHRAATYYISGSVLSTLHIKSHLNSNLDLSSTLSTLHTQSHLVLLATLRERHCCRPYVMIEEIEVYRV